MSLLIRYTDEARHTGILRSVGDAPHGIVVPALRAEGGMVFVVDSRVEPSTMPAVETRTEEQMESLDEISVDDALTALEGIKEIEILHSSMVAWFKMEVGLTLKCPCGFERIAQVAITFTRFREQLREEALSRGLRLQEGHG